MRSIHRIASLIFFTFLVFVNIHSASACSFLLMASFTDIVNGKTVFKGTIVRVQNVGPVMVLHYKVRETYKGEKKSIQKVLVERGRNISLQGTHFVNAYKPLFDSRDFFNPKAVRQALGDDVSGMLRLSVASCHLVPMQFEVTPAREDIIRYLFRKEIGLSDDEIAILTSKLEKTLIADIKSNDNLTKRTAWTMLKYFDSDAVVAALVAELDEWEGGLYTTRSLLEIGSPKVVRRALIELLEANPNIKARSFAIEILGNLKAKDAKGVLLENLKYEDANIRTLAVDALRKIKEPSTVPNLLEAMKDSDVGVRINAVSSLGALEAQSAVPKLIEALQDKTVASTAARALGSIGDRRAIPYLLSVLTDNKSNKYLRSSAAEALGEFKYKKALPHLITLLKEEDWWLRSYAAGALQNFDDPSIVDPLIAALVKESNMSDYISSPVRAAGSLCKHKFSKKIIQELKDRFKTGNNHFRVNAAWIFGCLRAQEMVPLLISTLQDKESIIRRAAIEALGKIKDPRAIEPLLAIKGKLSRPDRHSLAEALKAFDDPRAKDALKTLQ